MPETTQDRDPGVSAAARCPVVHWFAPNETGAHPDPFPWYEKARAEGRVFFLPAYGMYVVTRHADVLDILRDPITYSNREGLGKFPPVPDEIRAEVGDDWVYPIENTPTISDPPEHTRLRKLLAPLFTPRRMAAYEGDIRQIANMRIDDFATRGQADLAAEFAYRIPNTVIARLIGADDQTADKFVPWVDALMRLRLDELSHQEEVRLWRVLIEQDAYGRALVADRRAHPAQDLTTAMIQATTEDGEPKLTDEEIVTATLGFIGAGSETTAIMILHAAYLLLKHPEQWAAVTSDPTLIPAAVEEALRLMGPIRGIVRTTTQDTELGGVAIPKGSRVWFCMSSANHDEDVFERPEQFDIHRAELKEHLAFGRWTHFCIGAALARLEGRVALETLIERLPDLRLAPGYEQDFGYHDNLVVPLFKALRVEWD